LDTVAVDERTRHELHTRAAEVLGAEHAETLMSMLPPVGWADVATRRDLDALQTTLQQEIALLRSDVKHDMTELKTELKGDIHALRNEFSGLEGKFGTLQGQFGQLEGQFGELRGEFGELRGEMGNLRADVSDKLTSIQRNLFLGAGGMMLTLIGLTWAAVSLT
jgi:predicted nuclease with TOPRIM domain